LLLLCASASSACSRSQARPESAAPAASAVPKQVAAVVWPSTQLQKLSLHLDSKVKVSSASDETLSVVLDAEVALVGRSVAGEQEVLARLSNVKLSAARTTDAELETMRAQLAEPALYYFAAGRLERARVTRAAAPLVANLHETLAAAFQLAPGTPGAVSWSAKERDAAGEYLVKYERTATGLTKHKTSYQAEETQLALALGNLDLTPQVVASTATLTLAGTFFARVTSSETLNVGASGTQALTNLSLESRGAGPLTSEPEWSKTWSDTEVASALSKRRPAQSLIDAARAQGKTFAAVLADLEQQELDPHKAETWGTENGKGLPESERQLRQARVALRSESFGSLAALLKLDDKNVALAEAAVRRGSKAAARVEDALAAADTPRSQQALVALADDAARSDDARLSSATSLIRIQAPTSPTLAALTRWIRDPLLASHAIHGLGSLSRRLRDAGDTERAELTAKPLLTELQSVTTDSARIQVLRGIANSGYAGAFDAVQPLVTAQNRDVRGAALEAVRHMRSDKVDPLLAERLKADPDAEVRLAALNAIKLRECSKPLTAALVTATSDAEGRVRQRAAALLGRCRNGEPDAQAALTRLAASDPATSVREAATSALGK
jgi:hypothetical protein